MGVPRLIPWAASRNARYSAIYASYTQGRRTDRTLEGRGSIVRPCWVTILVRRMPRSGNPCHAVRARSPHMTSSRTVGPPDHPGQARETPPSRRKDAGRPPGGSGAPRRDGRRRPHGDLPERGQSDAPRPERRGGGVPAPRPGGAAQPGAHRRLCGPALVGATKLEATGGGRWTFTASGPTTNLAARIAGLTRPRRGQGGPGDRRPDPGAPRPRGRGRASAQERGAAGAGVPAGAGRDLRPRRVAGPAPLGPRAILGRPACATAPVPRRAGIAARASAPLDEDRP